ncbi:MAG: cupin domain-containing protein [Phycisphaeraceae bacterium]
MAEPVHRGRDVEAKRVETSWGVMRWVAGGEVGNAEGLTLGRVRIKAGQCNPRHCHRKCEEVLYLLKGRLEHTVGDERYALEAGDAITVPAGVFHNATVVGDEDAEMIVAFSSAERDFVLESEGSAG